MLCEIAWVNTFKEMKMKLIILILLITNMIIAENIFPDKLIFKNNKIGTEFKLSVVGYQFPKIKTGYDANWLNLHYECFYNKNSFETTDPTLLTEDLDRILRWFKDIYENHIPEQISIGFMEPNLTFILYGKKNNLVSIGIKLDLECKPSFRIDELGANGLSDDEYEFIMQFELNSQDLNCYINQLMEIKTKYPIRGKIE